MNIKIKQIEIYLPDLYTVGDNWLYQCSELKQIKLDLPELHTIGNDWLHECPQLKKIIKIDDNQNYQIPIEYKNSA